MTTPVIRCYHIYYDFGFPIHIITYLFMLDTSHYISKYLIWRQQTGNLNRDGLTQYRILLRYFNDFLKEHNIYEIEKITFEIIKDYQEYLACKKNMYGVVNKVGSQNNTLVAVRSFLRWLQKEGFLITDPSAKIEYAKDPRKLDKKLSGNYPGGKGGVFQKLINLIPPHEVYIETHLGNGSIIRKKRPAKRNIGIEIDPKVIQMWNNDYPEDQKNMNLIHGDAISFLIRHKYTGNELIYCDPPYLRDTRKKSAPLYKYEYTFNQHKELLDILKILPCKIMISGYQSTLYSEKLKGWHSHSFQAITSSGMVAMEHVWMNYPPPLELHDYRYLGDDFRQREHIKIKKNNWMNRFNKLCAREKKILLNAMKWVWLNESDTYKLFDYHSLGGNFRERERSNLKRQRWIKQLQKMPVLEKLSILETIKTSEISFQNI